MAKIPIYEQRTAPSGSYSGGKGGSVNLGLGEQGRAMQQMGQALGQAADVAIMIERDKINAKVMKTLADSEVYWREQQIQRQNETSGDPEGYTQGMSQDYDAWADTQLKGIEDNYHKRLLGKGLTELRNNVQGASLQFEATQGRKHRFNQRLDGIQSSGRLLFMEPNKETLDLQRERNGALIDDAFLPPDQKKLLLNRLDQELGRAGADSMVENNPQAFLDGINNAREKKLKTSGSPFLDLLPAEDWDSYINAAQANIDRKKSQAKSELERRLVDVSAMAADGISDPQPMTIEQFNAAYKDPKEASRRFKEYQNTQKMAKVIAPMGNMTNAEIGQAIQNSAPVPVEGYKAGSERQQVVARAGMRIVKERDEDPAQAVSRSSSSVKKSLTAMEQVLTDPETQPEQLAEATSEFVVASLAEQERLGITNPRILTNSQTEAIGQRIASGTESAADLTAALEQQYGQYFPQVMDELMAKNKLSPAMMIIPDIQSPATREQISRISGIKRSELEAGVDPVLIKDAKEQVTSYIAELRSSFGPQDAQSAQQIAAYQDIMERMAIDSISRGNHSSGSDAAEAAQQLLLGQYQFDGNLRMPASMDASAIQSGLERSLENEILPSFTIDDVPKDLVTFRTPEEALEEWRSTVESRSFWLSDPTTTKAQLWAKGADGAFYRVRQGGNIVEVPYDKAVMANIARQQAVDTDTIYGP